jgi:hypothetical protein
MKTARYLYIVAFIIIVFRMFIIPTFFNNSVEIPPKRHSEVIVKTPTNKPHIKTELEIAMEKAFKKHLAELAKSEIYQNKYEYEQSRQLEKAYQMFNLPTIKIDQYIEWLEDWVEQGGKIKYCTICPYQYDQFRYCSTDLTIYPLYGFDSMIILFEKGCLPGTSNPGFDIGQNTVLYWTDDGKAAIYGNWEPEAGEKVFNRIKDYQKIK